MPKVFVNDLWPGTEETSISPLSNLTNLDYLYLFENQIADRSPLVQNTGINQGDVVDLYENLLSGTSLNTYIPQLEARGVNVYY